MENKINIAELLKDCPKGMELDCAMYEDVKFMEVDTESDSIILGVGNKFIRRLNKYGKDDVIDCAKCVIFPKGKTTWEGFIPPCKFSSPCKFKNGDIIYVKDKYNQEWCSILSNCEDGKLYTYIDFCINSNTFYRNKPDILGEYKDIIEYRLATEKEKEKLFNVIKDKGYRWDTKTKTLEKLIEPKFKVGNRIKNSNNHKSSIVVDIKDDCFIIKTLDGFHNSYLTDKLPFNKQDDYELVPNKFDINTLKPFDKVLIRLTNNCVWMPKLFSHYDTDSKLKYYPFVTIDNIGYSQCIPYKGNEHLCRKTYDCDEFYKTWK